MKKFTLLLSIPLFLFACKSDNKSENNEAVVSEVVKQEIAYASFGDKITDENVLSNEEIIETYKN